MKKIVRWGFIGCGEATEKKSGPAFQAAAGSEVVAVMRRDAAKCADYARRNGIKRWYTDAQDLVADSEVDAVYVATPPSTHVTYAIMALKAGKPVYVEKPLATHYTDCCRINHVAEEMGQLCFVAYYRRLLPYFQCVKRLVDEQKIGRMLNVQINFAVPPRDVDYNRHDLPWRLIPDIAGGGYFYDLAPHQIDLLQMLFGPILYAEGFCANRGGLYKTEDTVSASFKFASGLVGSGSWCFVADESGREDRITLIGDKGKIEFAVFNYTPIKLYNAEGYREFSFVNPPHVQQPLIQQVVNHILQKEICTIDSIAATSVNWVIDRILGKI